MSIITETAFFKSVAPKVTAVISPEDLELALLLASTTHRGVNFSVKDVDSAMSWYHSPQGRDFWERIHHAYRRN